MAKKIGTLVRIISGGHGAFAVNNQVGIIIKRPRFKKSKRACYIYNRNLFYGGELAEVKALIYIKLVDQNSIWGLCPGYKLQTLKKKK